MSIFTFFSNIKLLSRSQNFLNFFCQVLKDEITFHKVGHIGKLQFQMRNIKISPFTIRILKF